MALIRWDPFRDIDRFLSDDDWGLVPMVRRTFADFPVDVYQTENEVTVELGVPSGIDPEKIDISVVGDTLTARTSAEDVEEKKAKNYFRREIRRGTFERSILLPAIVKADQAKASYEQGILKIVLPKAEEARVKKIEVKVKK